jgi:hypothetical protein
MTNMTTKCATPSKETGSPAQIKQSQKAFTRLRVLGSRLAVVTALAAASLPNAYAVTQFDVACDWRGMSYAFHSDGLDGDLVLRPASYRYASSLTVGTRIYNVTWKQANPQDLIDGKQGPGFVGYPTYEAHRIFMWIDFANTPNDAKDDQRFDGYMFMKGTGAIAGVGWFDRYPNYQVVPIGFYAIKRGCIPG